MAQTAKSQLDAKIHKVINNSPPSAGISLLAPFGSDAAACHRRSRSHKTTMSFETCSTLGDIQTEGALCMGYLREEMHYVLSAGSCFRYVGNTIQNVEAHA